MKKKEFTMIDILKKNDEKKIKDFIKSNGKRKLIVPFTIEETSNK